MKTTDSVNTLARLFMEAAEREGFRFVYSPREEFPCATKAPQILWLDKPQFLSQEGNQHGRQRYRLRVALLRREVKDTEEMRMAYMTYLQDMLVEMFTSLSTAEGVAVVEGLQSEVPAIGTANDAVVEMSAEVEMIF